MERLEELSKARSSRSVHASLGPSHTPVNIRTAPSPRTKSQLHGRALPPSRQRLRLTPRRSPTLTRIRTTRTPPYQRRVRATCVGWLAGGLGWVWVSGPGAARMWGPLWPPPLYGGGMPLPPAGERLVLRGASFVRVSRFRFAVRRGLCGWSVGGQHEVSGGTRGSRCIHFFHTIGSRITDACKGGLGCL